MVFDKEGTIKARIKWYFVPTDRPFLPFPNNFVSNNWVVDQPHVYDLGEAWDANRPYSKGSGPTQFYGMGPCGQISWWSEGVPTGTPRQVQPDTRVLPPCCRGLRTSVVSASVGLEPIVPQPDYLLASAGVEPIVPGVQRIQLSAGVEPIVPGVQIFGLSAGVQPLVPGVQTVGLSAGVEPIVPGVQRIQLSAGVEPIVPGVQTVGRSAGVEPIVPGVQTVAARIGLNVIVPGVDSISVSLGMAPKLAIGVRRSIGGEFGNNTIPGIISKCSGSVGMKYDSGTFGCVNCLAGTLPPIYRVTASGFNGAVYPYLNGTYNLVFSTTFCQWLVSFPDGTSCQMVVSSTHFTVNYLIPSGGSSFAIFPPTQDCTLSTTFPYLGGITSPHPTSITVVSVL